MNSKLLLAGALILPMSVAFAGPNFVNGGFENGNLAGWTVYSGSTPTQNPVTPGTSTSVASYSNGGLAAAIMTPGNDPIVGAALNRVYGGSYSVRVGDDLAWGYGGGGTIYNAISQTTTITDSPGNLYFAWAAVMEISGHSTTSTPFFQVNVIKNGTASIYDVSHYETDGGFWLNTGTGYKYSSGSTGSAWQVVNLDLGALGVAVGDTLTLNAIARDCTPSAHFMYVYLDGFGAAPPTQGPGDGVPDAGSTLILFGLSLLGFVGLRRKLN